MRIMWIVDKLLRLAALATALIGAVAVLFTGVFSTDSGTPLAMLIGLTIFGVGGAFGIFLLIAIFLSPMKKKEGASAAGSVPIATICVYVVGILGVAAAVMTLRVETPVKSVSESGFDSSSALGATASWRGSHRCDAQISLVTMRARITQLWHRVFL
jgi:hypothetical protein